MAAGTTLHTLVPKTKNFRNLILACRRVGPGSCEDFTVSFRLAQPIVARFPHRMMMAPRPIEVEDKVLFADGKFFLHRFKKSTRLRISKRGTAILFFYDTPYASGAEMQNTSLRISVPIFLMGDTNQVFIGSKP